MRDITLEDTVYFAFTTRSFTTGVPTVLAGSPVLSVLESNNATPITAGVSVSVDRASVVGLNQATVVATAANGYEAGKSYAVYISTGTVGGVSVVGEVVAAFTIQASAAAVDLANATDGLGALKMLIDALNNITAASVWAVGARVLTAGTNIALAKGTGVTGFNDLSAAQVNAEADTAIADAVLATAANLAVVDGIVDTIVAKTNSLTFTAANQVDANTLAIGATAVTSIWDKVITGTTTAIQGMRGFLAVLLGKASGLATTTATYRNIADSKDVVVATVDADGNRAAITRDLT